MKSSKIKNLTPETIINRFNPLEVSKYQKYHLNFLCAHTMSIGLITSYGFHSILSGDEMNSDYINMTDLEYLEPNLSLITLQDICSIFKGNSRYYPIVKTGESDLLIKIHNDCEWESLRKIFGTELVEPLHLVMCKILIANADQIVGIPRDKFHPTRPLKMCKHLIDIYGDELVRLVRNQINKLDWNSAELIRSSFILNKPVYNTHKPEELSLGDQKHGLRKYLATLILDYVHEHSDESPIIKYRDYFDNDGTLELTLIDYDVSKVPICSLVTSEVTTIEMLVWLSHVNQPEELNQDIVSILKTYFGIYC